MENERIDDGEKNLKKFKFAFSEILGRYFVATKDLTPGEVILRENVYAVGPGAFNKNYMCFACLKLLEDVNAIKRSYSCTNCNVAIFCSSACQEQKIHHSKLECEAFRNNENLSSLDSLPMIMQILLPLRVWLLQDNDREMWTRVLEMEAHVEERRDTPIWQNRQTNVIEVLKNLKLIPSDADNEVLQRLCSILDVNSFELRPPGGTEESPLRGLYPDTAIMAHECVRNTHITVDDKFQLTVYASLPIKAEQPILVNYTSPLLGTEERREHLRTGKYFECVCSRCSDPKELDSNLSTLVCPRCKNGFVTNHDPLRKNVYDCKDSWQCEKCERRLSGKLVQSTLILTKMLITETEPNIANLEKLLKKMTLNYHKNHFFVLEVKTKLLELYKKECTCLNPDTTMMARMVEIGQEMIDVFDIVEPGISRSKGILLWEMHLPLVLLADRDYSTKKISATKLVERLEDAGNVLKRSLSMLLLEPPGTPEGFLARQALKDLKCLRTTIAQARVLEKSVRKHVHVKQQK